MKISLSSVSALAALLRRAVKKRFGVSYMDITVCQEAVEKFASLEHFRVVLFGASCGSPRKLDNLTRCKTVLN